MSFDMKYIDADLLRKEIEYLKAVHIGHAAITKETNAVDGLDAALQVVDSLQQEQPEVDLNEEIQMEWDSFNKHIATYSEGTDEVVWLNWLSFVDIANYFYELGLNARKEE